MLKQQNHHAISRLYDKYAAPLYGYILQEVRSKKIAEQILENSFVTIWENLANYGLPQKRLFIWMLGISKSETLKAMGNK